MSGLNEPSTGENWRAQWDKLAAHLQQRRARVAVVVLLSLLHALYLACVNPSDTLLSDDSAYRALGHALAMHAEYTYAGLPVADFMPAYPMFLAVVFKVLESLTLVRLLQGVLASVTVLWVHDAARAWFGQRAGVLAGVVFALVPATYMYAVTLNAETYVLFVIAGLLKFLASRASAPTLMWSALWGLLLGALVLAKPEYILWAPTPALLAWLHFKVRPARALLLVGPAVAGLAIAMAPWVIRNAVTFGAWIPLSTSSGRTLWVSAHEPPLFDFGSEDYARDSALCFAKAQEGNACLQMSASPEQCTRVGNPKRFDACMSATAKSMIASHPGAFAKGGLRRVLPFFVGSHTEALPAFSDSFAAYRAARSWWPLSVKLASLVWHTAILAAGLVGIAVLARRRRLTWVLGYLVVTKAAAHILIFATPRYGLHLYPIYAVAAAGACVWAMRAPAERVQSA